MSNKEYLRNNKKAKTVLRIVGFVTLAVGVGLAITAFVDFFISMYSTTATQPHFFWMFFVGFPLIFIGISCLSMGYMHAVNSYVAGEQAPIVKDVANYMLDGTREETAKTVEAVSQGIHGKQGPVCPKCHTQNEMGASFCDNCGEPLTKTCPFCGEANDADARYCRKCGKSL